MENVVQDVPCVRNDEQGVNRKQGWGWLLGSITLIALSAVVNVRHAVGTTTDLADIAEAGSFAVAMTVGFIGLPAYALRMAREGARTLAVAAAVGTLVCGAVSFTNLVGASMKHRLTTAVEASDATSKRADTRKAIKQAEDELATIGATRPAATIEAEIEAKLTSRRDLQGCEAKWLPSSRARSVCIQVNKLRAEKGTAERREALQRTISAAQTTLGTIDAGKTVGSADTAAIVLAAKMAGWTVSPEVVDLAKSVGTGFGVELLGALLLAGWDRSRQKSREPTTVQTPRLDTPPMPSTPLPQSESNWTPADTLALDGMDTVSTTATDEACETPERAGRNEVSSGVQSLSVPMDPAERLLQLVTERGGDVFGGHRSFARALGISHGHVSTVLGELSAAGKIAVEATKRGTRVRLLNAA